MKKLGFAGEYTVEIVWIKKSKDMPDLEAARDWVRKHILFPADNILDRQQIVPVRVVDGWVSDDEFGFKIRIYKLNEAGATAWIRSRMVEGVSELDEL